ncbi:uncharacterized protein PG998_009394 [Apiospora kogelbergensis]|uniref:uncharacterized protein n=1 Tax=Apiospora kogelbergensis TaxID=1337665 RepID=UPI0031314ED6
MRNLLDNVQPRWHPHGQQNPPTAITRAFAGQVLPPKGPQLNELLKEFKHLELEGVDEEFEDWQEHIAGVRTRGKQPPKKKRTAPAAPERGKK